MSKENNNLAQDTPEVPTPFQTTIQNASTPQSSSSPQSSSTPQNAPRTATQSSTQEPGFTQDEIQKKKDAFFKKMKLAGFLVIGAVAATSLFVLLRFAYNKTKNTYSVLENPETTSSSQEIINTANNAPEKTKEWEIYASEKYGFSFDYPKGDFLTVSNNSEDEFLVQVFSQDIVPAEKPSGENLIKGYTFQVKPLTLGARDLDSAVEVKKNSFYSVCPETASITDTVGVVISGIEGKGFKIYNCNADYSVDYVTTGSFIYEIIQVYKGDVGFKQVYKAKTNQITQSVVIDQNLPVEDPYVLYQSKYGFSFAYPRELDSQYSDVPYPPSDTPEKLITVAENDNTNAVGFFYTRGGQDFNFNDYITEQQQLLLDDFTVVKGRAPDGKKTQLSVGGQPAVKFEDYTWEGNDLLYVQLPESEGVLIISKTNISDEIFDGILKSIVLENY